MSSRYNPGRVAGCLYLLTGVSMVRPMYVGRTLMVRDDAAATIHNIAAHELLFRFGMVSDLIAGLGRLLAALAALFLRIHDHGFLICQVFAGLWLFPFGFLVFRSGFLPRILGLLLFVSGLGYLAISGAGLLFPLDVERVSALASSALLGEGGIILWLLIQGARPPAKPAVLESRAASE